MLLTVIDVNGVKFVRLAEFYDLLELDRNHYTAFIKRNITDHQIPTNGIDFIPIEPKKNPIGRPRKDYLISLTFLKTLCFKVGSVKSKHVKQWSDQLHDFRIKNV